MAIFLGIPLASLLHWILPVPGCSGCLFLGFVPCFDRGHHLVTFWGIIHTRTFFFPVKLHVWIILCSTLILDWWPECKIQGEVNFLSEFEDTESCFCYCCWEAQCPSDFYSFVSDLFLIPTPLLEVLGTFFLSLVLQNVMTVCPGGSAFICYSRPGLSSPPFCGATNALYLCCSVWWPPDARDKQALKCGWCDQGTACLVLSNFK